MNRIEVLITVIGDDTKVLETLRPLVFDVLSKSSIVEIEDSNIEENIGMKGKEIVLSFLISIAANVTYDGLISNLTDIVGSEKKGCNVEVIELGEQASFEQIKKKEKTKT